MNLLLKFVVMFLMSRADIIVRRINDCLDKLFVDNPNEEPVVPVCAVCDEILDEKIFRSYPFIGCETMTDRNYSVNHGKICPLIYEIATNLI